MTTYTPRWVVPAIVPARDLVLPTPPYHTALSADLQRWRLYLLEGGHCVLVAVAARYSPGGDPAQYLVAAPLRQVLRLGYTLTLEGFCKVDLPYDGQTNGALASDFEDYDPRLPVPPVMV